MSRPAFVILMLVVAAFSCGGRASGTNASTGTRGSSGSSGRPVNGGNEAETDSSASADAESGVDSSAAMDARACVTPDGGVETCGGAWRCCTENGGVGIEVLCVPLDASCPGPPPSDLADASGPNVDPSEFVVGTSVEERDTLCSWIALEFGGYGRFLKCDAGDATPSLEGPASLRDCTSNLLGVAQWPASCPLTVAQFESCVEWEVQNVCLLVTLTRAMLLADCQTLLGPQCLGGLGAADGGDQ